MCDTQPVVEPVPLIRQVYPLLFPDYDQGLSKQQKRYLDAKVSCCLQSVFQNSWLGGARCSAPFHKLDPSIPLDQRNSPEIQKLMEELATDMVHKIHKLFTESVENPEIDTWHNCTVVSKQLGKTCVMRSHSVRSEHAWGQKIKVHHLNVECYAYPDPPNLKLAGNNQLYAWIALRYDGGVSIP